MTHENASRLTEGQRCRDFFLSSIDNEILELSSFARRKLWLAFYRYGGCPMCATHMAEVLETQKLLEQNDITFIAIFDCPPERVPTWIRKSANSRIRVVADPTGQIHETFGAEKSWDKLLSMGSVANRIKAGMRGHSESQISGSMNMIPAHFLVSENGVVQNAYYGRNAGDHVPWSVVKSFAQQAAPAFELRETEELEKKSIKTTEEEASAPSFAVIYKWRVRTGAESEFFNCWNRIEQQTREQFHAYRGGLLYLDADQGLQAVTSWSKSSDWEVYWVTRNQTLDELNLLDSFCETSLPPIFLRLAE